MYSLLPLMYEHVLHLINPKPTEIKSVCPVLSNHLAGRSLFGIISQEYPRYMLLSNLSIARLDTWYYYPILTIHLHMFYINFTLLCIIDVKVKESLNQV